MKPVVDGLAKEYKDKVEFRFENVTDNGPAVDLANKMGITAVPTFIFVNSNGIPAANKVGGMSEDEFRKQLDALN